MTSERHKVLSDMRVVEVSAFVAAPSGGMTLAQMGADVIRVDLPRGGLDYRRWPVIEKDSPDKNVSLFWAGLNKHKKSVAIDFTKPQGQELASELITAPGDDAGMFLTNMPPRGWLEYARLKKQRNDLIQVTVQGDRHGGAAVDYTLNPRVGLPYLTGPSDFDGVVNHVLPAWDLVTGQMAALGLLAAERQRSRERIATGTSDGQHVKLSLEDVALAVMANLGFIAEAERGEERPRVGNDLFGTYGRDFLTKDEQRVMVVGLTSKQWNGLIRALELEAEIHQLADSLSANFRYEADRFRARDEISNLFERVIGEKDYADIVPLFDSHGVCWGKYQTVKELVETDAACSTENPMFSRLEQPDIGETLVPATPLTFGGDRIEPQAAPRLGEHTEEILLDVVGISSKLFGELKSDGILMTP